MVGSLRIGSSYGFLVRLCLSLYFLLSGSFAASYNISPTDTEPSLWDTTTLNLSPCFLTQVLLPAPWTRFLVRSIMFVVQYNSSSTRQISISPLEMMSLHLQASTTNMYKLPPTISTIQYNNCTRQICISPLEIMSLHLHHVSDNVSVDFCCVCLQEWSRQLLALS